MSVFLILLFSGILYELKTNYSKKNNFYQKLQVFFIPFLLFTYLLIENNYLQFDFIKYENFNLFLISSIFLSLIIFYSLNNHAYTIISILVVISFFCIIKILLLSNGLFVVFYIVTLVTSMDVFAYVGGNIFGKNKIAPKISNGKTIEGTFVGLLFTVLISILLKDILSINIIKAIILGISIGLLAFAGDLIVSFFKRKVQVKDSGNIFPGHGGLLDRFDGYILVLPLTFLYFNSLI